ncbi:hypothetical protein E2562_036736 [Oryza meyeriana var. granulata]|uniref:Uncharacterized protein n=1 Tax=Oryza meyeriana var. granulata TaxID=110450 RepID=A0A6G1DSQ1_9ORYZ|nr:hypothetical protein E2562_036736 [Oryza meyeriana var. granulata]
MTARRAMAAKDGVAVLGAEHGGDYTLQGRHGGARAEFDSALCRGSGAVALTGLGSPVNPASWGS